MDHWDLYSAVKFPGIGDTDMKTPVFSGITLFGDNIELMKSYMKPRRCWVIVVAGYDPSLPADEIKKALTDHFRSCGAILNVEMPRHPVESSVIIVGDDANEKALELNGSELGGRKLVVTARPFPMLKRKDVPFASAIPATSQNLLNKMTEE